MNEEWRKVDGFPAYSVSNLGRVRRDEPGCGAVVGRILRCNVVRNGYFAVHLWKEQKRHPRSVHRLVAHAFLPPPASGESDVAHFDGDRTNNVVPNLRWATRKDNMADAVRHGTNPAGSKNPMSKLKEDQVATIRRLLRNGDDDRELAKMFGVCVETIRYIRLGYTWKHVA